MIQFGLISLTIENGRGIVRLDATLDGKGAVIRGGNGAGKSSALDMLAWGLGDNLDAPVIRNGADAVQTQLQIAGADVGDGKFDDLTVKRRMARGKKPTLEIRGADKRPYPSPTELAAKLRAGLSRRTFSTLTEKEQAEVLLRLAPKLDCTDLDTRRAKLYEERTRIGNVRDELAGAAAQMPDPPDPPAPAPVAVGEEKSVAEVRARMKAAREKQAANDGIRRQADTAEQNVMAAENAVEDMRRRLTEAEERAQAARRGRDKLIPLVAALVDPDLAAIEAEEDALDAHNRAVREQQAQAERVRQAHVRAVEEARRARKAKADAAARAALQADQYKHYTEEIRKLDETRTARIAGANLPIAGLALAGKAVTFDDGEHGPVPVSATAGTPNTAARARLDMAIAAALGHRIVAIHDGSLLGREVRAEIDRLAEQFKIQVLIEEFADGEKLSVLTIEDADDFGG